jgi:N-formylglutamate deformylase
MMRRTVLDHAAIRSSEDAFVDHLFDLAPVVGAPFLVATAPRAYVDLNRACDELDPALIEGVRRGGHNPRVASGLGVVPRVVAGGRAIYRGKLSLDEARGRIRDVWRPYHDALHTLMCDSLAQFGEAVLIDCHSMPHEAIESLSATRGGRPEVVLGDRFGAAAGSEVVDQVEAAFTAAGLRVARNAPFAGAYITQAYGRPSRRQHVIQVEIDRALYMDECRVVPHAGFAAFKRVIDGVVAEIAGINRAEHSLAAE